MIFLAPELLQDYFYFTPFIMSRYFFHVFGKHKCLKDMFKSTSHITNSTYNVAAVIDTKIVKRTLIRTFICGKKLDGASFEYVTSSFTHAAIMGRMHNPGYGTINSFSCVFHQTTGAKL